MTVSITQPDFISTTSWFSHIKRGIWLILETIIVPTLLLMGGLRLGGLILGLSIVVVWRTGSIVVRKLCGFHVPLLVWIAAVFFVFRTGLCVWFGSLSMYLWQPVIMSGLTGLFFIFASGTGRSVMWRMVQDLVPIDNPMTRCVVNEMGFIWGGVHVVCAIAGGLTMTGDSYRIVWVHGLLGIACLVGSVGGCVGWGVFRWWKQNNKFFTKTPVVVCD